MVDLCSESIQAACLVKVGARLQGYACLLITAAALNEMRTAFAKCAAKLHGLNKVVADECPEHLNRMRTFDYFDQTVVQPDFQDPLVFVSRFFRDPHGLSQCLAAASPIHPP